MQRLLHEGSHPRQLTLIVFLAVLMALPGSVALAEHGVSTPAAPAALSAAQLQAAPLTHASKSPASLLGPSAELGRIAPATAFYFTVSFDLTNSTRLANLIQQQESPGSPLYRHFLTQREFDQEFGPSPLLDTEATNYFTSFGMTRVATGSPLALGFRAPASAVEAAFHTPIDLYRTSNGSLQYTNSQPLSLPAPLAGFLSSVNGISSFPVMQPTFMPAPGANLHPFGGAAASPPAAGTISQAVNWSTPAYLYAPLGSAEAFGGTPWQFMNPATMTVAYNATALYAQGDEGQGSTIAVVMGEGYNPSDLSTFSNETFGNPNQLLSRLSAYPVAGPSGNASAPGTVYQTGGLSFELAIDLEYSSTMAPRAHIDAVYGQGLDSASLVSDYAKVASLQPVPNVVTNSWGGPEDAWWNLMGPSWQGGSAMENEFEELAAMGSTVLFSSADDAGYDSATGMLSGSFPSTSPYVTSVGGTRTTVGNATFDAFPPANYSVTTTLAELGSSEIESGALWFPNVTVDAVTVHTVTNESYWYTPSYPGAPSSVPAYAGGGIGLSEWFQQPWWQHGFTVADTGRLMPADVAAEADFNETVYFDSAWNYYWGGTSFACPTVAGEIALIDTYLNKTMATPGKPFYSGLINPLLYDIANDQNITTSGYDQITYGHNPFAVYAAAAGYGWPGDQNWPDQSTGVTSGWNLLTGWGVPNVGALALDAATILGQKYYVAFANGTAALTAPNGPYTFYVQTVATPHTTANDAPFQLWFSAAPSSGSAMGTPVETTGTTSGNGNFTFDATTPGFLEVYVQYAGKQIFQSIWFSPARLTSGSLSIAITDGTPTSMMGGFDAYSAFYSGAHPYESPVAGPIEPNSAVVQVTYKATPDSTPVPVYNALVLGQTNYTGYWDSPPFIVNPEFNLSLLPASRNTSLTLTNLDGISYVPTWNVPVPETYWINATYLGLTASLTYLVTPRANVEGVGPIETAVAVVDAGPGYLGYSANNSVFAPAVTGSATYTLPVSFTNWEGQPLAGAPVDLALPPVIGPPYLSTPIPGTQTTTNATGIADFTITPTLSEYAEAIGALAIQVFNTSYTDAFVASGLPGGTPLRVNDSEGLLFLYTPAAYMSTAIYADYGAIASDYVGNEGVVAEFFVQPPAGVFSQWNNITALSYALDSAEPTPVSLGSAGQSAYIFTTPPLPALAVGEHNFTVWFSDSQGFAYKDVQPFWVIGIGPDPAPVVTVTSPTAYSYVTHDVSVAWSVNELPQYLVDETLTVEDGIFSATYNVTGSTGYTVPSTGLTAGQVTFTVTATNVLEQSGTASVTVWVWNVAPAALITSPATGASFVAGSTVTVGLSWSGDLLSKEVLTILPPSGTPQMITLTSTSYSITNVVVGTYELTLTVTSGSGASVNDTVSFTVTTGPPTKTTPVLTSAELYGIVGGLVALAIAIIVAALVVRSRRHQGPPPAQAWSSQSGSPPANPPSSGS